MFSIIYFFIFVPLKFVLHFFFSLQVCTLYSYECVNKDTTTTTYAITVASLRSFTESLKRERGLKTFTWGNKLVLQDYLNYKKLTKKEVSARLPYQANWRIFNLPMQGFTFCFVLL